MNDTNGNEEWLESLRRDMRTELGDMAADPWSEAFAVVADTAIGLAASYIRPLHARIAELEDAVATELTELSQPSPEMREVPALAFEAGDTITITALCGPQTSWSRGTEIHLRNLAEPAVVTVTRPVTPLPTEPGAVGTATVNGKAGCRVFRADPNAPQPWIVLDADGFGPYWVADYELGAYVSLDGSDL